MTGYKKPDRIVNPQAVGSEIDEAIYRSLRPLDEIAHKMEMTWGVDRLETLVPPELAMQFGIGKAQLDQAIDERNPQLVAQKAAALIRGWQALDKAAAHHMTIDQVATAWYWRHPETDESFAITKDNASAQAIKRIDQKSIIYTLDEVCRVLHSQKLVNDVKNTFPESRIEKIENLSVKNLDQEIDF